MKTFTIDADNSISVFATPEEAAATTATPFDTFVSQNELADLAATWPPERLVAIWNSLPGVKPVKTFKNAKLAAGKIWERIQSLGEPAKAEPKPKAKGAPGKGKGTKKTTPAKKAPRAAKSAKKAKPTKPNQAPARAARPPRWSRCSSGRTAPHWPTSWTRWAGRKHPVRGFMAGTMKKAGFAIESFKSDKGERTYRINQ